MTWEQVELDIVGKAAVISIAREEAMNALDLSVLSDLQDAFKHVARSDAKVIVLTGKGRAFTAGGDVAAMSRAEDPEDFLYKLGGGIHKVVRAIRESPRPVIAAINGAAVGAGLGVAMACDIKIAGRSAVFTTGFLKVGLAPGCGTRLLALHVGAARSMEMLLTSRTVKADEALEIGLVSEVVDDDALMERAMEVANTMARMPRIATARAKSLMQRAYVNGLDEQRALERQYLSASGGTDEFREGANAFVEKRKPNFDKFD